MVNSLLNETVIRNAAKELLLTAFQQESCWVEQWNAFTQKNRPHLQERLEFEKQKQKRMITQQQQLLMQQQQQMSIASTSTQNLGPNIQNVNNITNPSEKNEDFLLCEEDTFTTSVSNQKQGQKPNNSSSDVQNEAKTASKIEENNEKPQQNQEKPENVVPEAPPSSVSIQNQENSPFFASFFDGITSVPEVEQREKQFEKELQVLVQKEVMLKFKNLLDSIKDRIQFG